jgi:hypothetical protein
VDAMTYGLQRQYQWRNIKDMTADAFAELWTVQKGRCAICQEPLKLGARGVHVDHDHRSRIVRGLLCNSCNVGLGMFKDNPELLIAAIDYLKSNSV